MAKNAIERGSSYSEAKLSKIRKKLARIVPAGEAILTCGSYARREASAGSDIDFFVVSNLGTDQPEWYQSAVDAIHSIVPNDPAKGGAFGGVELRKSLIQNIGGQKDTNDNLTRRMLILLEGDWLAGCGSTGSIRRDILDRYIAPQMTDHQLALFLLNDIIRYYRTIAVDYEFKTAEDTKPWGIRNIKLIFSRKLLYASGLFSVAHTADRTRSAKIAILQELFDLPVIERLKRMCGDERLGPTLSCYEKFLSQLEQPAIREHLKCLQQNNRNDEIFRDLKNEGHHFTRELLKLFEVTFDASHPIRRAVIF